MNEDEVLAKLDAIIEGPGTKADRARALFRLGCDRSDVTELLGMTYSQAHSIWKRLEAGNALRSTSARVGRSKAGVQTLREDSQGNTGRGRHGAVLQLSPSQTRVATQDGHRVIKVDTSDRGTVCRACDRRLSFSIRWLAFVHADSMADPTELEDYYDTD